MALVAEVEEAVTPGVLVATAVLVVNAQDADDNDGNDDNVCNDAVSPHACFVQLQIY